MAYYKGAQLIYISCPNHFAFDTELCHEDVRRNVFPLQINQMSCVYIHDTSQGKEKCV